MDRRLAAADRLPRTPGTARCAAGIGDRRGHHRPRAPVESAAKALVGELGGSDVDPEAKKRIVAIAEGNPLYAEQLLAFVDEAGPEALETVPPTVEALLASRLDRLEPEERALLERAAVVGREFTRAAVVHLGRPTTSPESTAGSEASLVEGSSRHREAPEAKRIGSASTTS